ncbi:transposase, partial [Paracoccus yeei]|uniref:transposase n=1 Tax=Paracoccus yeei TaxID=147645 RepID=UPI001CD1B87D
MANKRPKPEEIVSKLRQVEVLMGQGLSRLDAIRRIGVVEQTYSRATTVSSFPVANASAAIAASVSPFSIAAIAAFVSSSASTASWIRAVRLSASCESVSAVTLSSTCSRVKVDWDAWSTRDLAEEDIVRLILDGTVIKTRLDRKATNISVLAAIGVRRDGQKVLLSIRNMGGESTAAWSQFLADLDARGLRRPEFVIVDGAPGLEAALVALWGEDLAIQRCTVHKHRNLLGHAPKRLH